MNETQEHQETYWQAYDRTVQQAGTVTREEKNRLLKATREEFLERKKNGKR